MARAGYCTECQTTVWLDHVGACTNGHAAECVSGIYDVVDVASNSPAAPARKKAWPFVVAGLVMLVLGAGACACVYGVFSLAPSMDEVEAQSTAYDEELADRLVEDYPGWECVTFDREFVLTSDGPELTCVYLLTPPGRDFSVGVLYDASGDGPIVLHDEILRPAGRFHDRSDALLDYLDDSYIKRGRGITTVFSDSTGSASVQWVEQSGSETLSFEYSETDTLVFDEGDGTWNRE